MAAPIDPAFLRSSDLFENQPDEVLQAVLAQGRSRSSGRATWCSGRATRATGSTSSRAACWRSWPAGGRRATRCRRLPGRGRGAGRAGAAHGLAAQRHRALPGARRAVHAREGRLPRPDGDAARVRAEPVPGAGPAAGGHHAEGPARLRKQLQGNLQVLRPGHRDPDPDRLAPDGQPDRHPGRRQAEGRRDLLLQGQHRPGQVSTSSGDDAVFQLFQSPLEGEFSFTGRNVRRRRSRPTSPCPPSRCSWSRCACRTSCRCCRRRMPDAEPRLPAEGRAARWDEPETVELAAAVWSRLKKGASPGRPAAGRPALLLRDLPDVHALAVASMLRRTRTRSSSRG